jgi:hypothetical protein
MYRRESDGAMQFLVGHVAVALDHLQTGPAANELYGPWGRAIAKHVRRPRVAAHVIRHAGQLQQPHPPHERTGDGRRSRRRTILAPSKVPA